MGGTINLLAESECSATFLVQIALIVRQIVSETELFISSRGRWNRSWHSNSNCLSHSAFKAEGGSWGHVRLIWGLEGEEFLLRLEKLTIWANLRNVLWNHYFSLVMECDFSMWEIECTEFLSWLNHISLGGTVGFVIMTRSSAVIIIAGGSHRLSA